MHIADNLLSIRRHTSSSYLTHQRNSTLLDISQFFKFDCDLQLVWNAILNIEAIIGTMRSFLCMTEFLQIQYVLLHRQA